MSRVADIAKNLDDAIRQKRELIRFSAASPFSLEEGYKIQDALVALQVSRGARIVGYKMGMTSKAKMEQMKISAPIYGVLTSEMERNGRVSLAPWIHPRIEPELAFRTKRELGGDIDLTAAWDACEGVMPALEIIDSRYKDFDFQLPDVVADNCSAAGFVLGALVRPSFPLNNLGMVLEVNGLPVQFASSAAVLGNPLQSLVDLVRELGKKGKALPEGSVVLSGGATAAVPLELGSRVRLRVERLGAVEVET